MVRDDQDIAGMAEESIWRAFINKVIARSNSVVVSVGGEYKSIDEIEEIEKVISDMTDFYRNKIDVHFTIYPIEKKFYINIDVEEVV